MCSPQSRVLHNRDCCVGILKHLEMASFELFLEAEILLLDPTEAEQSVWRSMISEQSASLVKIIEEGTNSSSTPTNWKKVAVKTERIFRDVPIGKISITVPDRPFMQMEMTPQVWGEFLAQRVALAVEEYGNVGNFYDDQTGYGSYNIIDCPEHQPRSRSRIARCGPECLIRSEKGWISTMMSMPPNIETTDCFICLDLHYYSNGHREEKSGQYVTSVTDRPVLSACFRPVEKLGDWRSQVFAGDGRKKSRRFSVEECFPSIMHSGSRLVLNAGRAAASGRPQEPGVIHRFTDISGSGECQMRGSLIIYHPASGEMACITNNLKFPDVRLDRSPEGEETITLSSGFQGTNWGEIMVLLGGYIDSWEQGSDLIGATDVDLSPSVNVTFHIGQSGESAFATADMSFTLNRIGGPFEEPDMVDIMHGLQTLRWSTSKCALVGCQKKGRLLCAGCRLVGYCSRKCAKMAWGDAMSAFSHRTSCRAPAFLGLVREDNQLAHIVTVFTDLQDSEQLYEKLVGEIESASLALATDEEELAKSHTPGSVPFSPERFADSIARANHLRNLTEAVKEAAEDVGALTAEIHEAVSQMEDFDDSDPLNQEIQRLCAEVLSMDAE